MNVPLKLAGCELCQQPGGRLIHHDTDWRVVGVDDDAFPAFYRVICNRHVAEFSELDPAERERCMMLVDAVERTLRERLQPTKINLASLGNVVPHLHWHVVARFDWDSHFPQPIWASPQRPADTARLAALRALRPELDRLLAERLHYA